MSRQALFAIASFLAASAAPLSWADNPPLPAEGTLQAAFSPWDDVEALVTEVIGAAQKQVLVQAYLLTSRKITTTLVAARRRGVDVRILLDAEQNAKASASAADELAAAGIPVRLETKYQNAHNKVVVVDAGTPRATVVTGSFNFTWTAQHRNAENVLVVRDNPALAERYATNWQRHDREAIPYDK